jgi:hypothetical protein
MARWSLAQVRVFDATYRDLELAALSEGRRFVEAYRAVVRMRRRA